MSGPHRDRRERERERERDDFPRKQPVKEPVRNEPPLGEYFLPGEGIDRQVLQSSICRFLGPEATCRPFEYEGVPGFKIRAVRAFTPEMLNDLRDRSREYVSENNTRRMGNRDGKSNSGKAESRGSDTGTEVSYEASQTRTRRDAPMDMDMDMDYQPPRSRGPLSPSGPTIGYTAPYVPESTNSYGYNAPYSQPYAYSGIPSSVGPSSGYPPRPYIPEPSYGYTVSREGPPVSQAPYGGYPPVSAGYGPEPSRMASDGYVFPSEPPRSMEHVRDVRDIRDIRDPRDPRDAAYPREMPFARDPRDRDPRDPRDPRDLRGQRDPRDTRDMRDPRDPRYDAMSGLQTNAPQHRDPRDPRDQRTSGSYDQSPRDLYNRPQQRR